MKRLLQIYSGRSSRQTERRSHRLAFEQPKNCKGKSGRFGTSGTTFWLWSTRLHCGRVSRLRTSLRRLTTHEQKLTADSRSSQQTSEAHNRHRKQKSAEPQKCQNGKNRSQGLVKRRMVSCLKKTAKIQLTRCFSM